MNGAPKKELGPLESLVPYLETHNGQRLTLCLFSIVATLLLLLFPGGAIALAVGIPFVFFVPGFAVVRLFFWKTTTPEAKAVLSLGLSILVVIFLGLILALTPIGLGDDSTRASLMTFSIAAVALETFVLPADRAREGQADQPTQISLKPIKVDKVVASLLATSLVISGVSLGLIVTAEYPSRTHFALTDSEGKVLANFTREVNSTLTVALHMRNGEDGVRNFTLVASVEDAPQYPVYTYSRDLDANDEWEQNVSFELLHTGYFKMDFDLYIQEGQLPPYKYGNLHFWLGVIDFSQPP